ncbi:MAG: class I SAM-dependent methyltransferase, partial [Chloroflexota bacterium]
MFKKSAEFYDAIYSWKDYATEALLVYGYIEKYGKSSGNTLLEVACGTGQHIQHLQSAFQIEGLDLDDEILKVALRRCPTIPFYQADMVDFDLGKQYDAVTCLFSSIGYANTVEKLNRAMQHIADHLLIGGVTVIEPWLMPDKYESRHIHAIFVDKPEMKIARMNVSYTEDGISVLDFHYLIATPQGVESFNEIHRLGLFTDAQYRAAFEQAGLQVYFESEGLDGRGLYVGVKA